MNFIVGTLSTLRNAIFFIVGLILCSAFTSSFVQAQAIDIIFPHSVNEDTPLGRMADEFDRLVSERLGDDKVDIQVHPNSSLLNNAEVMDALAAGSIQIASPTLSIINKYAPRLQVMDLPFLFVSPEAANNFLNGQYGERLLRLVQPRGYLGLGFLNNGMKQMSLNVPIKIPRDVRGKKFRIMNSDVLESQFTQVDAEPIKTSFKEVVPLLASGGVDGQENTWSNIYSKSIYQYQPYIVESNHGYLGYMLVTNKEFWESIPEEFVTVLQEAMKEAIDYGNKIALEKQVTDKNRIIQTKVSEVHQMTVEERSAWVDVMRPVWDEYTNLIGTELIQAAASSR